MEGICLCKPFCLVLSDLRFESRLPARGSIPRLLRWAPATFPLRRPKRVPSQLAGREARSWPCRSNASGWRCGSGPGPPDPPPSNQRQGCPKRQKITNVFYNILQSYNNWRLIFGHFVLMANISIHTIPMSWVIHSVLSSFLESFKLSFTLLGKHPQKYSKDVKCKWSYDVLAALI